MRLLTKFAAPLFSCLCAALCLGTAQAADTPITIGDGSLTISSAVAWGRFSNVDAKTKAHPDQTKSVTRVAVTMGGSAAAQNKTVNFSGQKCEVTVQYANTDVLVSTNPSGKNLTVVTDWSSFHPGATANDMAHNDASQKITHVVVKQAGVTVLDAAPNGGTKIVISYR